MSFYVNFDSADVWQHPQVFKLDSQKKMLGISGVPPDYFSKKGQLWNMPVYNWEYLKHHNYSFWSDRIQKNIACFDVIRFDHLRGFSAFWEVPAGEKDAING